MSNNRISYLNISPYSRQSPSQLKTELKKNSNSVERPKSSKSAYGASSSRGNTPINNPEAIDRKYSPFVDRKGELMASLYNIAKTKTREKPTSAKAYKQRENSASSKKIAKSSSRPADKINEKLQIYQYLQNKSFKKSDEAKSFSQPLSYTPSRAGSRSHLGDEKDNSNERRILEASILQQKQLIEALEEMHRSRNKASAYSNNRDNLANLLKSAQRPPTSTPAKAQYNNASVGSVGKISDDKRKGSDSKRGDVFKDLRLNMNQSDIIQPQQKQKPVAQTAHKDNSQQKRHRRGLSSGQNPLFVEQQMALEQQMAMEQQLALEQMAREQERQERQERERERERQERERQKQLQLQKQMEQQMLMQQQMQMQQQQQYARDPQAEEDEYYERFFHMDRMTFDFERLVIAQKLTRQQAEEAEEAEEEENKQASRGGNGSTVSHHRTRSIEDPNALLPTKSSSRWTTKRSSVGEEPQLEQKSVGNFISDIDKTDVEKEEMRRYYKH